MVPALLALLLSQVQPVKIVNPTNQSKAATTTTVGSKEPLDVNCVQGCSGGAGGGGGGATNPDGGIDAPTQAKIWDGTDKLDITAAGAAKVDGSAVTQPISAAALPLPVGAATEATLGTLLTSGTFTARLGTLGQKSMAGSTPVVFASDQTALPVTGTFWQATQPVSGPLTDAQLRALAVAISASSLPLPTGAATEATLGTLLLSSTFTARIGTLGQKAMSGSTPVVFASDQSALPITAAALPLPSGAATEATLLTRTKPADQQHAIVDSSALPTGAATETTLGLVKAKTDNLDVLLSTRTKPADQQHAIVDSSALPTGAATDGVLTGGTQKAILRGGAKGSTPAADVTSTSIDADHNAADVSVKGTAAISAAALPLPSGASTESTLALVKAKTDNIDVLLSTRTKPADQQHAIVDSSALPSGASTEATLALIKAKTDNLDVAISTRTKPADQQHAIVDSSALPTGAATETTLGTLLLNSTFTARLMAAASLGDNTANPTTTGVAGFTMLWDGLTWDRAPGNSVDGIKVNLGVDNDVTVTGSVTATVSGTVTANHGTPAQVSSANTAGTCVSVSSSTAVLASFASRKAAFLAADATNTDDVFVSLSGTATSGSFRLAPGQAFNIDSPTAVYTGAIAGIAASGTQKICASEL